MKRRQFVEKVILLSGAAGIHPGWIQFGKDRDVLKAYAKNDLSLLEDEDYWDKVRSQFRINPNITNFNNGGVSPSPIRVEEKFYELFREANAVPSYTMWRLQEKERAGVRAKLAELGDCKVSEVAICRNTTEALNNAIWGIDLKAGDEVILSKFDYPNMMNAWKQVAARKGVVLKWVDLNLPSEDAKYIIDQFARQITTRTKVMEITHLINWNGQLLPAKELCELATANDIISIVDAAHSFAHINFSIREMGCDVLGTSLHKWLNAPFGTGMLFVKEDRIPSIWPIYAHPEQDKNRISKFEHMGTRPFPLELSIGHAIDFHQKIGTKLKMQRLLFLREYWAKQVEDIEELIFWTSRSEIFGSGLCLLGVKGQKANEFSAYLFKNFGIHVTTIHHEYLSGIRITPNIYTSLTDLDRLVSGIKSYIQSIR